MIKDELKFFRLKAFFVIQFSLISLLSFNSYAGIDDDLCQAVKEGNTSKAAESINSGADVNAQDEDGWTALIWAVLDKHPETAKLLIDKGANVNAKSNNGWTPLLAAAYNGYAETAKLLIDKGANVNAKGGAYGSVTLMSAAEQGHSEIVKLLIDKGAQVNAKAKDGNTALRM